MKKRIILTGATGLVGKSLVKKLNTEYEIVIFSRSAEKAKIVFPGLECVEYNYSSPEKWEKYVEGSFAIIHLAGENVASGRWTNYRKQKIYDSRIVSTSNLVKAINNCRQKPEAFITSSATGYYGYSETKTLTEDSEPGEGFLAAVCADWEKAASDNLSADTRHVAIRTGIVLDKNEGALAKMIPPYKFFVGGQIGTGKQWMSWIHMDDLAEIYVAALKNPVIVGPVNGTAPNPVQMKEFASTLGKVLKRPSMFPVPGFVLKVLMGEAAEIALEGARVMPQKILEAGYNFKYPYLQSALEEIIN